jgi:hypothetical protein
MTNEEILEKIKGYFLTVMKLFMPETELEKTLDEIDKLKNNPDNYGKVAMMYLKLQNMHALLIGKSEDDNWNFFLSQTYGKQHKIYRELYFEHKSKINTI